MPREIIDITPALSETTPVFPGDPPFVRRIVASMVSSEASSNVSAASFSLHAGAHMDAPLHVVPDGFDIASVPLESCIGEALVVDYCAENADQSRVIEIEDVCCLFEEEDLPERILFKTCEKNENFAALSPDLIAALVGRGVKLIGIDAPSIDPTESESLPAHHAALDCGVVILENLRLANVRTGRYELIALPLNMPGAEASPVRAVLRELA